MCLCPHHFPPPSLRSSTGPRCYLPFPWCPSHNAGFHLHPRIRDNPTHIHPPTKPRSNPVPARPHSPSHPPSPIPFPLIHPSLLPAVHTCPLHMCTCAQQASQEERCYNIHIPYIYIYSRRQSWQSNSCPFLPIKIHTYTRMLSLPL